MIDPLTAFAVVKGGLTAGKQLYSMTKEISRQISEPHQLSMLRLPDFDIRYCTGCYRCLIKGRGCVIPDDLSTVLDAIAVGGFITIIVDVTIKQGSIKSLKDLKQLMLDCPQVQQCYYVTGNDDFIIIVTIENMLEYEKLTHKLFFSNDNIQKFNSTVVMENVKVGLDIPI